MLGARDAAANEGSRRLLAAAAQGERLDKRLWTGVAAADRRKGNTTSLVGTPEQVAEALCDYYDLGVTTFLIRGFDPLDDAIDYGRELIPLVRAEVARREAARAAGSGVSGMTWPPTAALRLRCCWPASTARGARAADLSGVTLVVGDQKGGSRALMEAAGASGGSSLPDPMARVPGRIARCWRR